jgi:hypothetical protein
VRHPGAKLSKVAAIGLCLMHLVFTLFAAATTRITNMTKTLLATTSLSVALLFVPIIPAFGPAGISSAQAIEIGLGIGGDDEEGPTLGFGYGDDDDDDDGGDDEEDEEDDEDD